jgi:hypothetical protein
MHLKVKISSMIRNLVLAAILVLCGLSGSAQKKATSVTSEMINRINEIVKPLREQVDKLLKEDPSGTYKAYEQDVYSLRKLKTNAEKSKATEEIKVKYAPFFKRIWSKMKVDENMYQAEIRKVFPPRLRERIVFQEFLNFSIIVPFVITNTIPPATESKCVDVCSIANGELTGAGGLIASGGGSYGNCFIKANSWSLIAGKNDIKAELKNNITIPGTFPSDPKKLRVKISFDSKQEATAIALFGTSTATTFINTFNGSQELNAIAPVIYIASLSSAKSYSEEYVIEKSEINRSILNTNAICVSVLLTGSWCLSECNNIRWTVCEEK